MAVSSEPLRSALVRSALLKSMRALPKPPSAVSFEPLRSALAKPARSSLIAPAPMNVASLKSPYDRCAPLKSSSLSAVPSVVSLHAIGQLLSPAARCLSISTVHGGAGGGGGEGGDDDGGDDGGDGGGDGGGDRGGGDGGGDGGRGEAGGGEGGGGEGGGAISGGDEGGGGGGGSGGDGCDGGDSGGGVGKSTLGSGEAASERRCSSAWSASSPLELVPGKWTRRASARWSRNGTASLRRAVQHVEPDHLEVEGQLQVPRLDQLEDPLISLLGRAAQRRARGGELRALSKVQHGGRRAADHAPEESAEVDHLLGTQRALLERPLLGVLGQVIHLPLEPVVATALLGFAFLIPVGGVGGHGARHARARVEAVGERAADGGQRQIVVGAARERHVQVSLGHEVVEHRDVGEQVAAHLARVDEEEAARPPLSVHEDRPVGKGVVVADDVRQVGVLLPAHVGQHHARSCVWCARRYDCVDHGCGGRGQRGGHRKHLARLLVHSPHRGKGVGPAGVLGVPHQHQLKFLPVHLLPVDRGQQLGARAARAGRRRGFREPPVARKAGVDCHAASGCSGVFLSNDTIEAPTHGQAPSTSTAAQSRAALGRDLLGLRIDFICGGPVSGDRVIAWSGYSRGGGGVIH
eukprot:scaffold96560_cov51-Phaeocystis_antarctica.AAC.1